MKILALTSAYPKFEGDATAPFIASITEHVAARGHSVDLVLPEHAGWSRPSVEGAIHYHPYRYSPRSSWTPWGYAQSLGGGVRLKRRLYPLAPVVYASARRTCRRLTVHEQFDVLHAHWLVPNGVIAAGVSGRSGIPLVLSLHGSDISVAEQKPWVARAARRAFGRASAVTAPSEDLLERAARLGARGDLRLMPYGADPDRFRPDPESARRVRQQLGVGDEHVLVVGVGRFVRWKGFDDLIAAVARSREEVPTLRLLLVGDGDLREELESQAAALGPDIVFFPGMAARDEVSAYLSAADLVAVPSVHAGGFVDGQPNVALEAMAAGKPLVVTDVGGLPDLVRSGENGLVVGERDRDALAAAIVSLATSAERRSTMGAAGRSRVLDELTWDAYADRLIAIYESASGARS